MLKKSALMLTATLFCCTINLRAEDVSMTELAGIYVGANPSIPLKKAISDFNSGMKLLYKKKLPVLKDAPGKNELAVVLGPATVELGLISKDEIAKVVPGGFVIKCVDGKIAIAGATPWCVRYGVGRFFEKLGLKFQRGWIMGHNKHTFAPKNPVTTLSPFTIADQPVFSFRNGRSILLGEMWDEIADPKKGADAEIFKGTDLWTDHSAGYLVPKDLYYDEHPEYYAMMKNGKRIEKKHFSYHRTPLCLSNPDVLRISKKRAVQWAEKEADKRYFFITYGDTSHWCQCPECLKLDPKPGDYASRLLHWVNPIAAEFAKKFPNKTIFTFAYGGTDTAPPDIKPLGNIGIVVATGCGNIPFWDHAQKSNSELYIKSWEKIKSWKSIGCDNIFVCEYIGGTYQPAFIDQTAARYKTYVKQGIKGVVFCYGKPKNFANLWLYLRSKLSWNPNYDPYELVRTFCQAYYQGASEPICRYFDLTHERYVQTLKNDSKLIGNYPKNFYTDDFIRKSVKCFNDAEKAVDASSNLKSEISNEKKLFLQDALAHLPNYSLTPEKKALISFILDELVLAAKTSNSFITFVREIDIVARSLNAKNPKITTFIREKINMDPALEPERIKNSLKFSPVMFTGADFGPAVFDAKRSHPSFQTPPKLCSGVLKKVRDSRGKWTSSVMTVNFECPDEFIDLKASLTIQGQDAITKSGRKKQFNIKSNMLIKVNGKEIYNGECGFVRGNWSGRTFEIPKGILKKGKNSISITNVSGQTFGPFAVCWILISDLQLKFE